MSPLRNLRGLLALISMLVSASALAQPGTPPPVQAARPAAVVPTAAVAPAAPAAAVTPAAAAAPQARVTPSMRAETLSIAREKLERSDEASVQQGLSSLAAIGGEPAALLVIARVRRGLPPQLCEAAIDTLVLLGRPSAATALLELVLHGRAAIRERAISALGALRIRSAQSALLFALDDPNAQVRAAAVAALGAVGDGRALPALYVASERGLDGALTSVGMIAKSSDLKALLARAPNADVTVIKPALLTIMSRKDFPIDGKLRVVQELSKLGSASARACLVEWLDAYKTEGPANLRKVLFDAIKRLDDLDKTKQKISVATTGSKS